MQDAFDHSATKFVAVKYWESLFLDCNSLWLLWFVYFYIKLQQHLMHLPKYYMAETKAIFNENIILLFFWILYLLEISYGNHMLLSNM